MALNIDAADLKVLQTIDRAYEATLTDDGEIVLVNYGGEGDGWDRRTTVLEGTAPFVRICLTHGLLSPIHLAGRVHRVFLTELGMLYSRGLRF